MTNVRNETAISSTITHSSRLTMNRPIGGGAADGPRPAHCAGRGRWSRSDQLLPPDSEVNGMSHELLNSLMTPFTLFDSMSTSLSQIHGTTYAPSVIIVSTWP